MKRIQINLIVKKEPSLLNKVIYFGLHYLRYIIVITQIVVIAVFFYRFKVDQNIIDLRESVDQKQEIFKITKPLIDEANLVDKKATLIGSVLARQSNFLEDTQFIFKNIPADIVLTSFESDATSIKLTGVSAFAQRVKQLNDVLKNKNIFKEVQVSKIERSELGYDFTILIIR